MNRLCLLIPLSRPATFMAATALAAFLLSACTGFTSIKKADGTQITRGHVPPGTQVTTASGGCIDTTGAGGCDE